MVDDTSRKRLGRGLAALIGEIERPEPERDILAERYAPIEMVRRNPANPRRDFDAGEIDELSASIRQHGIIQPVLVRRSAGNTEVYEIVAGERRWRAAQQAGLTEVPIIVRDVDDRAALEIAIVENVQRSDLNAVEEALGLQQLIDRHGYSQAELGEVIGKSRSHVANTLRLLKLPQDVLDLVRDGSLSAGHARTLVTAKEPVRLARRILAEGLSVRQAETLAQDGADGAQGQPKGGSSKREKDPDTLALEKLLADRTGLAVEIAHGNKGGEVRIRYRTLEQLDQICHRLQGG